MSTEIANAYISLMVKMPNAKKEIEKGLDDSGAADTAGKSAGNKFSAGLAGAIGGATASIVSRGIDAISASLDGAIARVDTMNAFPKIMQNFGYSSEDATKSINKISDGLQGLPTSVDSMAGMVQQLAPLTGSLDEATNLSLAFNNALLAGGKSTDVQANAMEQYTQMLSTGSVDLEAWRSVVTAMPGQMNQLAESMLGAGSGQMDLYDALKAGEVSMDDFNSAVMNLDENGTGAFASFQDQAVASTDGIATSQQNMMTAVTRGLANLIEKVRPQLTAFMDGMSQVTNTAFGGLAKAIDWIAANGNIVIPVISGLAAVVLTALAPAIGTAAKATWAWTAALLANPLTWIALGIGALVGALVWFFTQTELGKEVWTNFTTAIGAAWTWLWENVLSPVFTAIGQIFTWLYENVITPIVAGIVLYVQAWAAIFNWLWTSILSPTFTAIGNLFSWIYNSIILPIVTAIVIYVQIWGAIFTWLWDTIISPVFTAIGGIFTWLYENIVSPVFSGIQSAISTVADWITTTLWPGMQTVLGWLGSGFETMGKTITEVWNNIKAAAVAPINFVINSVYNDGIRKLMNDIVDTLGLDANWKMPHVSEIALASGGVLPGYTPGRDVHDFYSPTGGRLLLSGGEAIMRPEFTAALGRGGIDALNAAARSGGVNGVRNALGGGRAYANGGVWDDITGGIAGAASWIGDAVGNVAKIMSDPSGAIDTLIRTPVKALLEGIGGGNFGSMMAEIPLKAIDGIAEWAQKNILPPAPSSGEWIGGNTLERLRPFIAKHGLMITDTYRDPAYNAAVGGSPTSYHMDKENPAVDVAGSYAAMDAFVADVRAVGGWRQILWEVAGHYDHAHIAAQGGVFGDLPTKKFDNGGYLQPGVTTVYNGTGKPEPVFTSAQWAQMEDFANGGSGMPSELVIVDADRQLIGRMQVEADGRIKRDGEHRALEVMRGASRR